MARSKKKAGSKRAPVADTTGSKPTSGTGRSRSTGKSATRPAPDRDASSAPGRAPSRSPGRSFGRAPNAEGKHLVIVESPTKAKTINKYLGPDYVVMASVGHVRDLPSRNPKGIRNPVPGVDLDHDFAPTYEILPEKKKTVTDLRKAAKQAADVWFATDLDREGEAIAWHLAQALDVDLAGAKRVVFNAITKAEIQRAFATPHRIDQSRVDAQQARRVLDRIVGYQVSPLLWRKVATGLSAGRVQSVAVRLIVDREQEIDAFLPEESWRLGGVFTVRNGQAAALRDAWMRLLGQTPEATAAPISQPEDDAPEGDPQKNKGVTQREKLHWLAEHESFQAELFEVDARPISPTTDEQALALAQRIGLKQIERRVTEDPQGKGPARRRVVLSGAIDPAALDWRIRSIETKRTTSRPPAPFITSTLQQAAANALSFPASFTMRTAQQLYEGVELSGVGSVGLITYMRTDSTHLSPEAIAQVRAHIASRFGNAYLPEKPNYYTSSNKAAQEAHEAIRPTDVSLAPDDPRLRQALSEPQFKLYRLIWQRFVAGQMTPAQWDATTLWIDGREHPVRTGPAPAAPPLATFKANGRVLVFDGFLRVAGRPQAEEPVLPAVRQDQPVAPLDVQPTQHFTAPPPRYSEASLVKKLESEGIGRPSTYASIIDVIQRRKYVEKLAGRFHPTDLGKVVTAKLLEGFPSIMDVGYTREMEGELDKIEEEHLDWVRMLHGFYAPFKQSLDQAFDKMTHAKAESQPAPHTCPDCKAATVYRFGRNGRFLSCSRYPDCKYAAPIDRNGNPQVAELTDVLCPEDGSRLIRKSGRFGPYLAAANYPQVKFTLKLDPKKGTVILPKTPPLTTDVNCPKCQAHPLYVRDSKRGLWMSCSNFPKCRGRMAFKDLEEPKRASLELAWSTHAAAHPLPTIRNAEGQVIEDGYKPQIEGAQPSGSDSADEAYGSDAA